MDNIINKYNDKIKKYKKSIIGKTGDTVKKIKTKIKILKIKRDLKTKNVSLGTSKNNYIDPRIIFAFLKKNNKIASENGRVRTTRVSLKRQIQLP